MPVDILLPEDTRQADPAKEERVNPAAAYNAAFTTLWKLTAAEQEDLLDEMQAQYEEARGFMKLLWPSMIRNYKKYRSIADPLTDKLGKQVKGRANLFIPYPWAIVESELPRLAGRLPRIRAFPRRPEMRMKAEVIQNNLYYAFDRMDFIEKQILWLRQHSIYGWSPLYVRWRTEMRQVLERERDAGTKAWRLIKIEKPVWDDFDCKVLDVFDCFMQPGVEVAEEGDWFFFREWHSMRDIERDEKNGLYYEGTTAKVKDLGTAASGSEKDEGRNERDQLAGFQRTLGQYSYGKHEILYKIEDDRISVMIDRQILARVGDNANPLQEKPIISCMLSKQIGEPFGVSTIDQLAGLPAKLNMLSNAQLDNLALILQKVMLAKRYSQTDFNNLVMSAGNVILTDDLESLKFLETPDISQAGDRGVITTKEEIQFTSGISDYTVGVRTSARLADTATGVSSIIREANARFALKLAAHESGPLRKLVRFAHAYECVFMPDERQIWINGPNGYIMETVTIEEILVECDFTIEPGSSVPLDQLARRDGLLQLSDRARLAPQIVDQRKFWRELLESFDFRNAEDILIGPDPELGSIADEGGFIEAEAVALLQGQAVSLTGNDQLHIQGHDRGLQSEAYRRADDHGRAMYDAHLKAHIDRQQAAMAAAKQAGQNLLFGGSHAGGPGNPGAAVSTGTPPGLSAPQPMPVQSLGGAAGTAEVPPSIGG